MNVSKLSPGARDALTDSMFDTARAVLKRTPLGAPVSAATLQNALHIGYNRASYFLEAMQSLGLVSAVDPYNRRVVLAHQIAK